MTTKTNNDKQKVLFSQAIVEEITHTKGNLYQGMLDMLQSLDLKEGVEEIDMDILYADTLIDFYITVCNFHGISLDVSDEN